MNDRTNMPSDKPNRIPSWAITIAITGIMVTLFWFANRAFTSSTNAHEPQPETQVAQAWPTAPATYTPLPGPTAPATPTPLASPTIIPTATPIPLPVWSSLNELTVAEYTLSTVVQAISSPDYLQGKFGTDQVVLKAVGKVKVGIKLEKVTQSINGASIIMTLPPPEVLGVELLPERSEIISSQQRWVLSDYSGLETQALGKARVDLETLVRESPSMMDLSKELTKYRLTDHLRGLGFTDITFR